jgi:hypothetical protein
VGGALNLISSPEKERKKERKKDGKRNRHICKPKDRIDYAFGSILVEQ